MDVDVAVCSWDQHMCAYQAVLVWMLMLMLMLYQIVREYRYDVYVLIHL